MSNCRAWWLYGSVARGTDDNTSDLDVLVVGPALSGGPMTRSPVATLPRTEHLSLRNYSWAEVEAMASYGSLFLLHLHLEGRPLVTNNAADRLRRILDSLPPYAGADRDILGFSVALQDVTA